MTVLPRISVDTRSATGARVRIWLLQSGAQPVEVTEAAAEGLPKAPQHDAVTREDVADFVHALTGRRRSRPERFDDHGSAEGWPRGSY